MVITASSSGEAASRRLRTRGRKARLCKFTPALIKLVPGAKGDSDDNDVPEGAFPREEPDWMEAGRVLYPGRAANGRAMGQDRPLKLPKRFQASLEPRFPGSGRQGWDTGQEWRRQA